jgi:hypothetical protein
VAAELHDRTLAPDVTASNSQAHCTSLETLAGSKRAGLFSWLAIWSISLSFAVAGRFHRRVDLGYWS